MKQEKSVWIHQKHNKKYKIVSDNARMKDVHTGEWIDCVIYQPLYENQYEMFCREKESFYKEFVKCLNKNMTYKEKYEAVKAELERRMYYDYNNAEEEEDVVAQGVCASMIRFMDSLSDESTSEELETEIDRWYNSEASEGFENVLWEDICKCARHFANWQRERDLKERIPTEISETVEKIAHDCGHTFEQSFAILVAAQEAYQRGLKDKDKVINVKEY